MWALLQLVVDNSQTIDFIVIPNVRILLYTSITRLWQIWFPSLVHQTDGPAVPNFKSMLVVMNMCLSAGSSHCNPVERGNFRGLLVSQSSILIIAIVNSDFLFVLDYQAEFCQTLLINLLIPNSVHSVVNPFFQPLKKMDY